MGSAEVLMKSLTFIVTRKEALERAWHGLAKSLVLLS